MITECTVYLNCISPDVLLKLELLEIPSPVFPVTFGAANRVCQLGPGTCVGGDACIEGGSASGGRYAH